MINSAIQQSPFLPALILALHHVELDAPERSIELITLRRLHQSAYVSQR